MKAHPAQRVVVFTSALGGAELAADLETSKRECWVVNATNRDGTAAHALASAAQGQNAVVISTESMSTGVNFHSTDVGINVRMKSAEDAAQRIGRLARVPNSSGVAYLLMNKADLASAGAGDKQSLGRLLSSTRCLQVELASTFLLPNGYIPPSCEQLGTGKLCSVCDADIVATLKQRFLEARGRARHALELGSDDEPEAGADPAPGRRRRQGARKQHVEDCLKLHSFVEANIEKIRQARVDISTQRAQQLASAAP